MFLFGDIFDFPGAAAAGTAQQPVFHVKILADGARGRRHKKDLVDLREDIPAALSAVDSPGQVAIYLDLLRLPWIDLRICLKPML